MDAHRLKDNISTYQKMVIHIELGVLDVTILTILNVLTYTAVRLSLFAEMVRVLSCWNEMVLLVYFGPNAGRKSE